MTLNTEVINTKTRKRFINLEAQCNALHNNKYTYDNAIFTNMRTKFIVTCPEHGDFEITPDKHTSRKQGCQVCANILIGNQKRKSFKWFEEKANKTHNNVYVYIESTYVDTKTHIKIICPIHGEFTQKPDNHLQGKGCHDCGYIKLASVFVKSKETFIVQAKTVHKNIYDYSNIKYKNTHFPITIRCTKCGNTFNQEPNSHLQGTGCPSCAKHGFDKTKPAILYYFSINDKAYKIGITNLTVEKRYNNVDLSKIKILYIKEFIKGEDAYKVEQKLLKKYSKYKYTGPDLLQSGNTELITKDILDELQNNM